MALICSMALSALGEDSNGYLFRERGYQLGPLSFSPGARVEMVYSDNVLNSPVSRREDLLQVYSPALKLRLRPSDLANFNFSYTPRWNDYLKDEIDDYFTHNATAALGLNRLITTDFTLNMSAGYNEGRNTGLLEDELVRFEPYANLNYGLNADYAMAHGAIKASFRRMFITYLNETQGGNSVGTQDTDLQITRIIHGRKLQLVLRYALTQTLPNELAPLPPETTDPDLDPGLGNVLALNSPVGSDAHTLTLGVKGVVGRFSYDVTAGVTKPQIIYDGASPLNQVAQVQLQYRPIEKLDISVLLSRGQSTDARTGRAFKRTDEGNPDILNEGDTGTSQNISFYASFTYRMNKRIKTDLEIGRFSVTGIRTGASTDTRMSAGATLLISSRGTFDGSVSRTDSVRFQGTRQTQTYALGFGWKFSDFATGSIKVDRNEDRSTDDSNPNQSNELETIANTAQIGVSFTW